MKLTLDRNEVWIFIFNVAPRHVAGETSPDKAPGDDSAPKRIVHKLRSDVKVRI
jgi:hypothetical protein